MSTTRVDINSADLESLARLPGIGETLAERIVAYREQRRPFVDIVELAEVEGISIHMVNDIADRITTGRQDTGELTPVQSAEVEEAMPAGEPAQTSVAAEPGAPARDLTANGRGEQPAVVDEAIEQAEEQPPIVLALPDPEEAAQLQVPPTQPAQRTAGATRAVPTPRTVPASRAAPSTRDAPTAAERENRSTRSPILFWGYLLSAAAGALMGAVLALFFLLSVNGTLDFANQSAVTNSQQRTTVELQAVAAEQERLATELTTMTEQVEIARSQAATLTLQLATITTQQAELEGDVAGVNETLAALSDETERFAEELDALSAAAAGFERFLDGMRALLVSLEGTPAAIPTGTPIPTATATVEDPGSGTPATSTPIPTRTPRPSATPFSP